MKKDVRHIVWMDNRNTICCGSGDGKYFGSCDLNKNKPKCNEYTPFKTTKTKKTKDITR